MSQPESTSARVFTAVVPLRHQLPPELALLLAPVRTADRSAPDEYNARTEGVLLDDGGRVLAFIVRLAGALDDRRARTLVPVTVAALVEGPALHLLWTEEQLRAHPRLDEDLDRAAHEAPGEAPPTGGASGVETAKEGVEGGLLGAALGAIAGLALGGPIAAASLAVFFATGGSVLGMIAGASEETAEATVLSTDRTHDQALLVALERLEARLRLDAGLERLLSTTRMTLPMATAAPAAQAAA